MKTQFLLALAALPLLTGCLKERVSSSGRMQTHEFNVSDFNAVEISHEITCELHYSPNRPTTIEVESSDNFFRVLEVENVGNTLRIGFERGVQIDDDHYTRVIIHTNSLEEVSGSGNSRFVVDEDVLGQSSTIDLSGNSTAQAMIHAQELTIGLSGNAHADVAGTVDYCRLNLSGNARVDSAALSVNRLNASCSGNATALLRVVDEITFNGSGNSALQYYGSPAATVVNTSGNATVMQLGN